ncbi:acyl-ACP desaturase [Nitrospirillum viridazoti]|uniref:Rubrerythrin n=1 Tax=Nitrospirillum amazonense TaxID=28077 RepID=A0A560IVK5_9PROT|nr:ferritin-like domain-containing protein [Nitrospirillum amazonense]TWB62179.1 rubrerythrin [Nitrospirillum amazonense]
MADVNGTESQATETRNGHWTVAGLPWDKLDPSKVNPDILKLIKAAALVEYNGDSYADYLCNVFADNAEFCRTARQWAVEEVQHGEALGAWAERVDPSWNFQAAVTRFREGYKIDIDVSQSVRGSRAGELVARCIVETGTSSYYTALAEATDEPVLKQICRHIAADEFRHYKLFYDYLGDYLTQERLGKFGRLRISLSRINETEDDELSFAYHAANNDEGAPYHRETAFANYVRRAYSYYRPHHLDRMVAMVFKASGLKPQGWLHDVASRYAYKRMMKKAGVPPLAA